LIHHHFMACFAIAYTHATTSPAGLRSRVAPSPWLGPSQKSDRPRPQPLELTLTLLCLARPCLAFAVRRPSPLLIHTTTWPCPGRLTLARFLPSRHTTAASPSACASHTRSTVPTLCAPTAPARLATCFFFWLFGAICFGSLPFTSPRCPFAPLLLPSAPCYPLQTGWRALPLLYLNSSPVETHSSSLSLLSPLFLLPLPAIPTTARTNNSLRQPPAPSAASASGDCVASPLWS
jgi:hypothetical protein